MTNHLYQFLFQVGHFSFDKNRLRKTILTSKMDGTNQKYCSKKSKNKWKIIRGKWKWKKEKDKTSKKDRTNWKYRKKVNRIKINPKQKIKMNEIQNDVNYWFEM
jgi:hypothetical protein